MTVEVANGLKTDSLKDLSGCFVFMVESARFWIITLLKIVPIGIRFIQSRGKP